MYGIECKKDKILANIITSLPVGFSKFICKNVCKIFGETMLLSEYLLLNRELPQTRCIF